MVRFYAGYDGVIIRVEMQLRVQDALNTMGPIDREVLALRHFEELTNKALAMSVDFDRLKEIFLAAVEQHRPPRSGRPIWIGRAATTRRCGPTSPSSSPRTRGRRAPTAPRCPASRRLRRPSPRPRPPDRGADPPAKSVAAGSETASSPIVRRCDRRRSGDAPAGALPPLVEGPGSQIGPYRLLQQIGEGGMGAVFMAEQERPVRRRVALKVIKPGMDSAQVLARFEAERQALALMEHPNIASVLDAGATDSRPPVLRHGAGQGHPDHPVLRRGPAHAPRAAGAVRPRLPGDPARRTRRGSSTATSSRRTCWSP